IGNGAEADVVTLIVEGRLVWCVSEALLAEYELVLNRSKFRRIERWKITSALAMARMGELTVVTTRARGSGHEPDNRFLECAEAASAEYLITGNKRHFPDQWKKTRILNARELL